ncbi:MAG: Uma2 family endonuclease, partial [Lachnospiraceae bacterium]|nr:Uma2 family endonuclease [Lachnospiraceae bacterium]
GSASHDYIRKYALYEKAGVREYWLVNPQNKEITVCTFPSQSGDPYPLPDRYSFDDQVKVGIFDDLTIDFREIEI